MTTEAARAAQAQRRHDRMVALQAASLRAEGFDVAAAAPGWTAPAPVEGQVPDAVATRGDRAVVVEVETEDTISSAAFEAQHKAFRKWKEQSPRTRDYRMVLA